MRRSLFVAAFESGVYRPRRGTRVDLAATTRHDRLAALDFARARAAGFGGVHESARWPVVEARPWRYDFRPLLPCVRAARALDLQISWTLADGTCPDDIEPMRPVLVRRLAGFARAFARFLRDESDRPPCIVPVDQITARAWLGGEMGHIEPFVEERGLELQIQLVRAAIVAADAIRDVIPDARIACAEPLFHVAAAPDRPEDVDTAAAAAARRFEVTDMLCGRAWPQLGGEPRHLDLVGATVYPHSQWYYRGPKMPGPPIEPRAAGWRPLHEQLQELGARYGRPVLIAGTGSDGATAQTWLRYACREIRTTMLRGTAVASIALAPAVDCPVGPAPQRSSTGMWGHADEAGRRPVHFGLAAELALQRACFARLEEGLERARADPGDRFATLGYTT